MLSESLPDDEMGNKDREIDRLPNTSEVRHAYEWKSTRPSMAVVEAVAATTGERPTDLETLNDVMDADALDDLLQHSAEREQLRVGFEYHDTSVVVHGEGTVVVRLE